MHHRRRNGWRRAFDPGLWRAARAVGMVGAASMAILACAVALARDTTGHDWYAAVRITTADLLIAVGFDEDAPVEYRRADGSVETVSRFGLTVTLEARWAREDILETAWDGATLGALSGLGGALLCLAQIWGRRDERRTGRPAYEQAIAQEPEAQEGLSLSRERLASAPPSPAPGFASAAPSPEATVLRPGKPDAVGAGCNETASGKNDDSVPARHTKPKRDYGRWL